jgi:lipopolysaccharide transport system ATP-binding protein
MSEDTIAIRVSHLSKEYRLGGPQEPYHTFRDAIINSLKAPLKIFHNTPSVEGFWALKQVSFEVNKGEVVGVIGRNGAGKSTLLKILSRITSPTGGTVELHGRVGSLLEVGTGFHPELTGRENIYLSGSILGMKRKEIDAKLNDIVSFSEIEKFLDTPVKRYSSGMYVRLAFAVAAHLEPEILLVDEVLAVGDAVFQKKCLGKMGDVAKEGRTVIFVSHNMSAVRQLCHSCILFDKGQIKEKGTPSTVIEHYLAMSSSETSKFVLMLDENKAFQLTGIRILDKSGNENNNCNCDYPILIELKFIVRTKIPGLYGYMTIQRNDGTIVIESDSFDSGPNSLDDLNPAEYLFHVQIPARTLGVGNYQIYLNFTSHFNIASFNVDSPGIVYSFLVFDETSPRGNNRGGYFSTKLIWENVTFNAKNS